MLKFNEVTSLINFITRSLYPQFYPNVKVGQLGILYEIWEEAFKEYSFEEVKEGLKTYVKYDTKGVPPTPAQLLAHMIYNIEKELTEPEVPTSKGKVIDFKKKDEE